MSAEIFISFASQDDKVASTICKALENRGFKCWVATRDILPGENFQSSIVRAIRGAKVLLLVFTQNSNRSEEMTKELALASQQKLMVVPLRVENVTPSDAFAYEFATRQWIDLFADWERAMNHLCARLTAALEDDRTHTDTIVLGKPTLKDPDAVTRVAVAKRKRLVTGIAIGVGLAIVAGALIPLLVKPAAEAAAGVGNVVAPAAEAAAVTVPAPAAQIEPAVPVVVPAQSIEAGAAIATVIVPIEPANVPADPKPATAVTPAAKPKPSGSSRKSSSNLPY